MFNVHVVIFKFFYGARSLPEVRAGAGQPIKLARSSQCLIKLMPWPRACRSKAAEYIVDSLDRIQKTAVILSLTRGRSSAGHRAPSSKGAGAADWTPARRCAQLPRISKPLSRGIQAGAHYTAALKICIKFESRESTRCTTRFVLLCLL